MSMPKKFVMGRVSDIHGIHSETKILTHLDPDIYILLTLGPVSQTGGKKSHPGGVTRHKHYSLI